MHDEQASQQTRTQSKPRARALPYLRKFKYELDDSVLIVSEIAAYALSEDYGAIGLHRSEVEDWLSAYFREHRVLT